MSTMGLTGLEKLNDNLKKSIICNLVTAYPTMREIINKSILLFSNCNSQTLFRSRVIMQPFNVNF